MFGIETEDTVGSLEGRIAKRYGLDADTAHLIVVGMKVYGTSLRTLLAMHRIGFFPTDILRDAEREYVRLFATQSAGEHER